MLRQSRLILMVLVAMFVVAVPTAVAQTPATDQYQTPPPDDSGTGPADDSGTGPADDSGTGPAADSGASPVTVQRPARGGTAGLPFTGGQVSLIALIGLVLLALGAAGFAVARGRKTSAAA